MLREAWEKLKSFAIDRDLMLYCWCGKMSGSNIRNLMAHPVTTKKQAEELLTHGLCDEFDYLRTRAMTYVSIYMM